MCPTACGWRSATLREQAKDRDRVFFIGMLAGERGEAQQPERGR